MNGQTAPPQSNQGNISTIVRTLAAALIICIFGIFVLIYNAKEIPTELWLLTSNIATAVTAMLVKTTPTTSVPETKPTGLEQPLETKTV